MTSLPYDPILLAAVRSRPQSIPEVLKLLRTIDVTCVDGDGLKWFNQLYLQVTEAVQSHVTLGGFGDPRCLQTLDVQFARLYFDALEATLQGMACPACWAAPLSVRTDARIARIQFALAGVNAHINHDLPQAIVVTARGSGVVPAHGTPQHNDFVAVDAILDPLMAEARRTLHVRLLGDAMPIASHVENTIGAWSLTTARKNAWNNGEILFRLPDAPPLAEAFLDSLDGIASFAGKALLVPA